jgi:hypothetical protein
MFRGFFRRLAAGPQSSQQTTTHQGDVTVTYTEDTSAPYPHYMHQPVTEYGEAAEQSAYDVISYQAEQQSTPEGNELAARLLSDIERRNG